MRLTIPFLLNHRVGKISFEIWLTATSTDNSKYFKMPEINQQQAFFFMPDISGFTKFVNETEIKHSTQLIKELLEIIVNANNLNLELQEIRIRMVY